VGLFACRDRTKQKEKDIDNNNNSLLPGGQKQEKLIAMRKKTSALYSVQAAAMTGGSGSPPTPPDVLCATGLPWSSGESAGRGTAAVTVTTAGTSLTAFVVRLDFLLDFDAPSSPPARLFFFERSATGRSSSEVAVWLPAVCSVGGAGGT
jgi:hypothetical protein